MRIEQGLRTPRPSTDALPSPMSLIQGRRTLRRNHLTAHKRWVEVIIFAAQRGYDIAKQSDNRE